MRPQRDRKAARESRGSDNGLDIASAELDIVRGIESAPAGQRETLVGIEVFKPGNIREQRGPAVRQRDADDGKVLSHVELNVARDGQPRHAADAPEGPEIIDG